MRKFHLGLIGWPLKHSLSPVIHNAALKAVGLAGDYRCYPVQPMPKGLAAQQALLGRMRRGELHGLNVTLPHKETILSELDRLTLMAKSIGAVNTIFMDGSDLVGDNTDQDGFLTDLENTLSPEKGSVLVLGAGGAARSVAMGLNRNGWKVWVAARRIVQAETLAKALEWPGLPPILPIQLEAGALSGIILEITLVVNATPVGMTPSVEISPWPQEIPFPDRAVVYDLVYTPRETRLTRDAKEAGLAAVAGLGMLVEQAALAFERWTDLTAPRKAMRQAAAQAANQADLEEGS